MPPHRLDDRAAAPQAPSGGTLSFRDGPSALACIYYWAGLLLLQPCVLALRRAASQYGHLHLPGAAEDGLRAQQAGWQRAARICQALDFALARTEQPDLLVVPLVAAERFYSAVGGAPGQGAWELLWCEDFRERLAARGEVLAGLLRGREWTELARF